MPRPESASDHFVKRSPHHGIAVSIGFREIGYPRTDVELVNRGNETIQTKDSE